MERIAVLKGSHFVMFGAALLVGCAFGGWLGTRKPERTARKSATPTDANAAAKPVADGSANQAPPERAPGWQSFDRAVMYLAAHQEEDGHWDAANCGAAPEFQGTNGDIALTGVATYVLLCATQEKNKPALLPKTRAAMKWLHDRVRPDGLVADLSTPVKGEPVMAQMWAAMCFLQAASLSTRQDVSANAKSVVRAAITKMMAVPGGYGTAPGATEVRADLTALGIFVFRVAVLDNYAFNEPNGKERAEIEARLKAGLAALDAGGGKKGALFKETNSAAGVSWEGTCAGLLSQMLLSMPEPNLLAGLKHVYGEFDKTAKNYPALLEKVRWGTAGEGHRAFPLWQGSLLVSYRFGEGSMEWQSWVGAYKDFALARQSSDGGWEVAGDDAKRGRAWRTAFHALSMILLSPAPPPAPPADPEPAPPDSLKK